MVRIAPSILSADFSQLGLEINRVEKAGADVIHVDVMDGVFVPNISIGIPIVEALRKTTRLPLDCHLMIVEPIRYIPQFVKAGADWISFHQEAEKNPVHAIELIESLGAKPGMVVNPETSVATLEEYLHRLHHVLVMSVNPGFGGQAFMSETFSKVKQLDELRRKINGSFLIEVDGGVSEKNSTELKRCGADVLVAGNAIFKSSDPELTIQLMRNW